VRHGLLWLAWVDHARSWLRSGLSVLALALAVYAIALFGHQVELRQADVLAGYEAAGASSFVVELAHTGDRDLDGLADALRSVDGVASIAAPYNGVGLGIGLDVSFEVFRNENQQEYLGARTSALGIDQSFDLVRDYYVDFHDLNANAPKSALGLPLFVREGEARPPHKDEVLVPTEISDYVGVRPGAKATIEFVYAGVTPPIVQRAEGLRLIGAFDMIGPDQGRFDPFWRFAARGREVLTVRRPRAVEGVPTTLPTVVNANLVSDFLAFIDSELHARNLARPYVPTRSQLVARARSIGEVPTVQAAVKSALEKRNFVENCNDMDQPSFCLRSPERNNFETALREHTKVARGANFFVILLLTLIGAGAGGLQVQTILRRWRDIGVLQAVGFSPRQILYCYITELSLVLIAGVALAAIFSAVVPEGLTGSLASLAWAAAIAIVVAGLAAFPVLLWPLMRAPADVIREST
jgi:hypothetical protein